MTDAGTLAGALANLPSGMAAVARVVQGVLIHRDWARAYGVSFTPDRLEDQHVRSAGQRLTRIFALDSAPLDRARPPERRSVGTCRDFTLLSVAILRAHGIPARARCGFGAYFSKLYEDHWVVEYRRADAWVLADAQIDSVQANVLKPAFDLLDVPRDKFVIAFDAWQQARSGKADPERFGIFDMRGLWFIAGNVVRDFAALNKVEMLPWDVWDAMADRDRPISDSELALFDRLADLCSDPDETFGELRALYEGDARLRVPKTVFNAVSNRPESV